MHHSDPTKTVELERTTSVWHEEGNKIVYKSKEKDTRKKTFDAKTFSAGNCIGEVLPERNNFTVTVHVLNLLVINQ